MDGILLHRKRRTDALKYIFKFSSHHQLSRKLLNVISCAKCIYCVILSYHSPFKEYQFSLPFIIDPVLQFSPLLHIEVLSDVKCEYQ